MPPAVTTGMLTAIPELLPRLIMIVLNHTDGSRAITRAGTFLMSFCSFSFSSSRRRSFSAADCCAVWSSVSTCVRRSRSCSFSRAVLRKFQICWKKPDVAPVTFDDVLCNGEAKVCVQTRSIFCRPSASLASTAMMMRLATSKVTSQMGARCRISFCVRTKATVVFCA